MLYKDKIARAAFENDLCDTLIDIYRKEKKVMEDLGLDSTYRKADHPSDHGRLLLKAASGMMPTVSPLDVCGAMLANTVDMTQHTFQDTLYNEFIPSVASLQGAATGLGLMLVGIFATHYFMSKKPEHIKLNAHDSVDKSDYHKQISFLRHLDLQRYDITFQNSDVFGTEPHHRYTTTPAFHRQRYDHLYKMS